VKPLRSKRTKPTQCRCLDYSRTLFTSRCGLFNPFEVTLALSSLFVSLTPSLPSSPKDCCMLFFIRPFCFAHRPLAVDS